MHKTNHSEKYGQEEITNLNEIDELLNTHNQYVTIATIDLSGFILTNLLSPSDSILESKISSKRS
jgi:hypothetical protein